MQNFNFFNDYELIYYFKEGNNKIIIIILNKYLKQLNIIKKKIFNKYYFVPLSEDDLNCVLYFTIKNTLNNFNFKFNISYFSYLKKIIKWSILNFINVFISKKHSILNNSKQIDFKSYLSISYNYKIYFDFILKNLNYLTLKESTVLIYKLKGKSNQWILDNNNLTYKQLDNSLQRAIKKMKLLFNKKYLN